MRSIRGADNLAMRRIQSFKVRAGLLRLLRKHPSVYYGRLTRYFWHNIDAKHGISDALTERGNLCRIWLRATGC